MAAAFTATVAATLLIVVTLTELVSAKTPQMWIGTAPDCDVQPADCELFGFDYVRSETRDCVSGQDVLCAAPLQCAPHVPSPVNELHVMTYNIFDLGYRFSHTGQIQRTCRIPAAIARDHAHVDVIVFEEVFVFGCWPERGVSLRDLLLFYGFPYFTRNVGDRRRRPGEPNIKVMNGGVMIASRHPIVAEAEYEYVALETTAYQRKGVMYARVRKSLGSEAKTYHVFGTHAQHNNSSRQIEIRKDQAFEFRAFIDSRRIPADEPTILAGDFNMDFLHAPPEVMQLLEVLDAAAPPVVGERSPSWGPDNELVSDDELRQFIDYVLYDVRGLLPRYAAMHLVKPRSQLPFRVCVRSLALQYVWPDAVNCLETIAISDLSDHYAVIGKLVY